MSMPWKLRELKRAAHAATLAYRTHAATCGVIGCPECQRLQTVADDAHRAYGAELLHWTLEGVEEQ